MKIIQSDDIFNTKVSKYLKDSFQASPNLLYISATNNIFRYRKKSIILSPFFEKDKNFFNSDTLDRHIINKIRQSKGYLPLVDMYFILKRLIDSYFYDNEPKHTLYKTLYYKLFELYKFLIFHDINKIDNETLQYIKKKYSDSYFTIFDIYNKYVDIINQIIKYVNSCEQNQIHYKIQELDVNLFITKSGAAPFNTFISRQKEEINNIFKNIDTLYLDGFIAFNDFDKYIISTAQKLNKEIVFITKNLHDDINYEFLLNNVYGYGITQNIESIILSEKENDTTKSIDYIRNNIYKHSTNISKDESDLIDDGGINFISPFLGRNEEIKFIVNSISEIIQKEIKNGNIENITDLIENDILIVSAVDKDLMAKHFDNQFTKIGLFVFDKIPEGLFKKEIDLNTFKNIYYNIKDFLSSNVSYKDGNTLNNQEKLVLFYKAFFRIKVPTKLDALSSSPILDFIFQLYSISNEGITIEKFKAILFSSWYYHVGIDNIKWDTFLGSFCQIEPYFENKISIKEWINEIERIIKLSESIKDDDKYKFHPFNSVSHDDLKYLLNIMRELDSLCVMLSSAPSNLNSHISLLKNKIINSNKIFELENDKLTDSQKVIKEFCNILNNFTSDSSVQNLDSDFFIKHLKNILSSIEIEEESNKHNFKLQIQNMLNLKHYKYVFFMGLENEKYPRKHENVFPFTQDIIDIIRLLKINSYNIDIYDHNLLMEKFFFKNVLDFAQKHIWFTCSQYEGKHKNHFSIYAEEISTSFNHELSFTFPYTDTSKHNSPNITKSKPIKAVDKKIYPLKELVTFPLCPKLYYHLYVNPMPLYYKSKMHIKMYAESVMYTDLMERFMTYNLLNKKWYTSDSDESFKILDDLSETSINEIKKYFGCLRIPDFDQIKKRVLFRIKRIIEDYIINNLNYHTYTIVKSNGKVYPCGGFDVKLEYDTAIFSNEKGSRKIGQNKIFLDFLTLKCTTRKVKEKHYKDMLNLLNSKNKYLDRIFYANRIISKINVQFDSNVDRFINGYDGGIERVANLRKDILSTDFSKVKPCPSNFCDYCIVKDICMGGKESQKIVEVID